MILIDTSVWIDYLGGFDTPQTRWLEQALSIERLGLTDLILCEILQGIRDESKFNDVYQKLLEFEIFHMGGIDLAIQSARNFRTLKAQGFTIRRTIDCLIATYCLENGHQLLYNDSDFSPFEQALGLQVIHS
jgi:predicted nucleic acid-binding protein